jgi:hypothetical protein
MSRDEIHLEKITEAFTRAILLFPMKDKFKYIELARRLENLIDFEVRNATSREERQIQLQAWGPNAN